MAERPFAAAGGLFWEVGLPRFGAQDVGVSPGGALDLFALQRGNILLGQAEGEAGLEVVAPPRIAFAADVRFVLTGARRAALLRRGDAALPVGHGRVTLARAGDELELGGREYGFRTYFCWCRHGRRDCPPPPDDAGLFAWREAQGRVRLLPGPEHGVLERPDEFVAAAWRVSARLDRMGMRLEGPPVPARAPEMVSQAVADGTVQLPPGGPIVLLRQRQTCGGYPRVANVVSADVDLLAQYGPGQLLRFAAVTLAEARAAARAREEALAELRAACNRG